MKFLDLTLPTPAENLACDEALLDACEAGESEEVLLFWEPQTTFVVVGYGNRVASEVNVEACRAANIPILRRCSGGGTVLQGPGCLNYSVILKIQEAGPTQSIAGTNRFALEQNQRALEPLLNTHIKARGHTDLTILRHSNSAKSLQRANRFESASAPQNLLKFSGNAQRRKRNFLIFHGTFLLYFDISSVEKYLTMPSLQPEYRQHRSHADFLINLEIAPEVVKHALQNQWRATEQLQNVQQDRIEELSETKYATDEWNFRI